MDVKEYKQAHPQFQDLEDSQVVEMVYETHYKTNPDIGYDQFVAKFNPTTDTTPVPDDDKGIVEELGDSFMRGVDQIQKTAPLLSPFHSKEDVSKGFAEQSRQQAERGYSKQEKEFFEDIEGASIGETFKEAFQNPRAAAAVTAMSLGQNLPSLVGAGATLALPVLRTNPLAKRGLTALVASSLSAFGEGANEVATTMDEYGYNTASEEDVLEALNNPHFMKIAEERGIKRGSIEAAAGMLSMGLAGKLTKLDAGIPEQLARFGGETVTQAGIGMGAEAIKQKATTGELTPSEIALEGIGEGVTATPQAILMSAGLGTKTSGGITPSVTPKTPEERNQSLTSIEETSEVVEDVNEIAEYQKLLYPEVDVVAPLDTTPLDIKPSLNEEVVTKEEGLTAVKELETLLENPETNPIEVLPLAEDLKDSYSPTLHTPTRKSRKTGLKKVYDTQGNPYDVTHVGKDEKTGLDLVSFPDRPETIPVSGNFSRENPKANEYVLQSRPKGQEFRPTAPENFSKGKKLLPFLKEELHVLQKKPTETRTSEETDHVNNLKRDITSLQKAGKTKPAPKKTKKVKPTMAPLNESQKQTKSVKGKKNINTPRPQKLNTLPVTPNKFWEKVPDTGASNVFHQPLTPQGQKKYSGLIKALETSLSQVAGEGITFQPTSLLASEVESQTPGEKTKAEFLRGVQIGNVVYVALDINDATALSHNETLLHEAYHIVRDEFDVLSAKDKQVLKQSLPSMEKTLIDHYGFEEADLINIGDTGPSEIEATLFGLMMSQSPDNVKIPTPVQAVFNKIKKFFERVNNQIKGLGFTSYSDIFENIAQGNHQTTQEVMQDIANSNQTARLQKMKENYQVKQELAASDVLTSLAKFDTEKFRENITAEKFLTTFQKIGAYAGTGGALARISEVFAAPMEVLKTKTNDRSTLLKKHTASLEEIFEMDHGGRGIEASSETVDNAGNLLDYLKRTEQSFVTDSQGRVVYTALDGKIKRADLATSVKMSQIQEHFKGVIRDHMSVTKAVLSKLGVDPKTTSLGDLQYLVENGVDGFSTAKMDTLKSVYNQLQEMTGILNANKAYVPWVRKGENAISVTSTTDIDPDTGKGELLHLEAFEKMTPKNVKELKAKLETLYQGQDVKISKPFVMTRNEITRRLGKEYLTSELLASLAGQNSKEGFDSISARLLAEENHKGLAKHYLNPRKIEGYSTDWHQVFLDSTVGSVQNLVNLKYLDAENSILSVVESNKPIDPTLRKTLDAYIDYNFLKPENDMSAIRQFNYHFAMGGNISTAYLNFFTLPTNVAGFFLNYNRNLLRNNIEIAKAFKDVFANFIGVDGVLDKERSEELVAKGAFTEGEMTALQTFGQNGYLQPSQAEDYIGVEMAGSRVIGGKASATKGITKILELSSAPIRYTENMVRAVTGLASYRLTMKDSSLNNAVKALKDDKAWNAFYERRSSNNPEMTAEAKKDELRTLLAMFAIDYTHGIYGKEGRNYIQRGWLGSLVVPFATFPQNTFEILLDQYSNKGAAGKAAAIYTSGMYILLAGAAGIPAWDFLQKLYDMLSRTFNMKPAELEKDLQDFFVETLKVDPEAAQYMVNGGLHSLASGTDMGSRMGGASVPMLDFIASVMYGEDVRDVMGVVGSAVKPISNIAQGEPPLKSLSEALPVTLRNFIKSYQTQTSGLQSGSGTRYLNEEEMDWADSTKLALGFRPYELRERQNLQYYSRFEASQDSKAKQQFATTEANMRESLIKARRKGDTEKVKSLTKKIKEHGDELREWGRENSKGFGVSWLKGYRKMVDTRVQQRLHPNRPTSVRKFQNELELRRKFNPSDFDTGEF